MIDIEYITDNDFANFTLKYEGFSIVECISKNYGQLQLMQPVLSKLKDNPSTKLRHLRIDIQQYPFIVEQFYVLQVPSYLLFYKGEFIDRLDGVISFNDFSQNIQQHITSLKIEFS